MEGYKNEKDVLELKINKLISIMKNDNLSSFSNELKICIHELKGLSGMLGYFELFNLFHDFEKTLNENNFHKLKLQLKKLENLTIDKSNVIINYRKFNQYLFVFEFKNINLLNQIITNISDCAIIVNSRLNGNKIFLNCYSYCSFSAIQLLCNCYKIELKHAEKKVFKNKENFLNNIQSPQYFNENYLHLLMLESIANFATIANKKYKFKFKSNSFFLENRFLQNFSIVIAELIKNVFSHSQRKSQEIIKIKCNKNRKTFRLEIYNQGHKIKGKVRKKVFERYFSTSENTSLSGQGIGLFDIKKIISNWNGTISLKNRLKGPAFIVKIPS